MKTLQDIILGLADTIVLWRDIAVVILAGIVIGCLWLYVSIMTEK